MGTYLQCENLKMKHTFTKKLIIFMPFISLLFGMMSPLWFAPNSLNWWYIMILPGHIALLSALVNQKEEKKLKYMGVICLPINLKKVWISKIIIVAYYILISGVVLALGIFLGELLFPNGAIIPVTKVIVGILIISITSLWQIPLCFFISRKAGLFPTILMNSVVGIALNLFTVDKSLWWLCPYNFTARLMTPILGILPNGLIAEAGNHLLNSNVIGIGITLSIVFFSILLLITSNWFNRQEVR